MRRSGRQLFRFYDVPVLWHNPACSKSQAALELLVGECAKTDSTFEVRPYLNDPPTFSELKALQKQLGLASLALHEDAPLASSRVRCLI